MNERFIYIIQEDINLSRRSIHQRNRQEVCLPGQSQSTRENIVPSSSLFRRISTNDPLNEPILYSSAHTVFIMGKRWERYWEEKKMPRSSKGWNKKATMKISETHLPDTKKEMCNFQIIGQGLLLHLNTLTKLYFHDGKVCSFYACSHCK